jgi:hypothetical protein
VGAGRDINTKTIHYDLYFFGKFGAGVAIPQL